MLQYSNEEIDRFIRMLRQDVIQAMTETQLLHSVGFALGRLDPNGVRKRSAHIMYAQPVRTFDDFHAFSDRVRDMARRTEAECAGCVVSMPACLAKGSLPPEEVKQTVMIHYEQLITGSRCWYAQLQLVDEVTRVTNFQELILSPHPDNPYFLPVEMYGAVTVQA